MPKNKFKGPPIGLKIEAPNAAPVENVPNRDRYDTKLVFDFESSIISKVLVLVEICIMNNFKFLIRTLSF